MNPGLIALIAAVVATVLIAVVLQRRNGRFRAVDAPAAGPDREESTQDVETSDPSSEPVLTVGADEVGSPLGERLTLLQFSSAFCSPCRATRALLADVTADRADVAHVEIDAESHLDLVRRLDILRTPTVLVLDARGVVVGRASGLPRREQVLAVIGDPGQPGSSTT